MTWLRPPSPARCATDTLKHSGRFDPSVLATDGNSCHRDASAGTPEQVATFGAGTIIDVRNGSPSLPCGSSSGLPDHREAGRHRTSPTPGDHRVSPATAALVGSHLRPPGASIPPWCACLRPGLSSGAFRSLTVTSAASTNGWSASGHVPLRTGRSAVEFDVSVDGFIPEQGRQLA